MFVMNACNTRKEPLWQGYRTLVENNPDTVACCGADMRLTYVNPAWEKVYGITFEQVINVPVLGACRTLTSINKLDSLKSDLSGFDFSPRCFDGENWLIFSENGLSPTGS